MEHRLFFLKNTEIWVICSGETAFPIPVSFQKNRAGTSQREGGLKLTPRDPIKRKQLNSSTYLKPFIKTELERPGPLKRRGQLDSVRCWNDLFLEKLSLVSFTGFVIYRMWTDSRVYTQTQTAAPSDDDWAPGHIYSSGSVILASKKPVYGINCIL